MLLAKEGDNMTLQELKELVVDIDVLHLQTYQEDELNKQKQEVLKAIDELERGESMLRTVREFKQKLAINMIHNKEDANLDMEINAWLIKNRLQILDMLDESITDYERRRAADD